MKFNFSLKNRIAFYWTYLISKTFLIWFEVTRPKIIMFIYEMLYSFRKFSDPKRMFPSPFETDYVETIFGKFTIRPHTVDMSTVSPAYERTDLLHLLRLLKKLKEEKKRVLFLDIGAYIGTFSVAVGNRFKDYQNIDIIAFEPALSNFQILERNVVMNDLRNAIEIQNDALYDDGNVDMGFHYSSVAAVLSKLTPLGSGEGVQTVSIKTLDAVIADRVKDYDAIVMKIDVEGSETEVLQGSTSFLKSGAEIYLMVEDFTNTRIISYLEKSGATFVTKVSPYNSWWRWY